MRPVFLIITVISFILQNVNTLNILGVFPYGGKSHFLVYRVYLKELVNRGHNVTVISAFPEKNSPKNYHDISIASDIKMVVIDQWQLERSWKNDWEMVKAVINERNCDVTLENKQVQSLIREKQKFDVVVFEEFNTDCALGIAYKLNAPTVAVTSFEPPSYFYHRMGLSFNPHVFVNNKPLVEKAIYFVMCIFINFYYSLSMQKYDQQALAKHFDDVPPLESLAREIKFHLIYSHFALTTTKSLPANIIEVGGYHVSQPQLVSGELKRFYDEAEHGIVFISFGSVVKSSSISPEKLQVMLDAFAEFPQRFIWKWDGNKGAFADKNKFYLNNWLPQIDILGHPKTLAFLTHAGLGSTTEGIYFGVPMLAMPITAEQPLNADTIEKRGIGVRLDFENLSKEKLVAALKKILDPTFKNQVKEVSAAWHDRPMKPLDTAIFWTEFAAKYPNLNFRSPVIDLPLYQYFCLDIISVIGLFVLVPIFVVYYTCCKSKISAKKSKHE